MSNFIFNSFLTPDACKTCCKQVASRLNMKPYFYYYDNYCKQEFEGDSNIYNFAAFRCYPSNRITFNLVNRNNIYKMGLENYVARYKTLRFHLTIKGQSFVLTCKFSPINVTENITVCEQESGCPYRIEPNGQLSFIL